jgi:hypothetical protein
MHAALGYDLGRQDIGGIEPERNLPVLIHRPRFRVFA